MSTDPRSVCQGKMTTLAWCYRKPTVERDGKMYCWQHDPVRKREKARKLWQEMREKLAALEAKIDADIKRKHLLTKSGVKDLTNDQLQKIISLGGISALIGEP